MSPEAWRPIGETQLGRGPEWITPVGSRPLAALHFQGKPPRDQCERADEDGEGEVATQSGRYRETCGTRQG